MSKKLEQHLVDVYHPVIIGDIVKTITINTLTLPNTNYFSIDAVHLVGSNVEKHISKMANKDMYGIQHLIEHLSFKSTKEYNSVMLEHKLKGIGNYNASTATEYTKFYIETNTRNANKAIRLIMNIAHNDLSRVTSEEFAKEKQIIYSEINIHNEDAINSFYCSNAAALYELDKRDTTISTIDTIKDISLLDVIKVKQSTLATNDIIYNVTYDPTTISIDSIQEAIVEEYLKHHLFTKREIEYDTTKEASIKPTPKLGDYITLDITTKENVVAMYIPIKNDHITYDLIADYILKHPSDFSLDSVIREHYGLVYDIDCQVYKFMGTDSYMVITLTTDCDDIHNIIHMIISSIKASINILKDDSTIYSDIITLHGINKVIDNLDLSRYHRYLALSYTSTEIFNELLTIDSDIDTAIIRYENRHLRNPEKVFITYMEDLVASEYTIIQSRKKESKKKRGENSALIHVDGSAYIRVEGKK